MPDTNDPGPGSACGCRRRAADHADDATGDSGLPLLGDGELYCLTHQTNRMHAQDDRACRWQR
jgi:hypothetical protein